MGEQLPAEVSALTFQQIEIDKPEPKYRYKSLSNLSRAVIILGGLNCVASIANIVALARQWQLLMQMGAHSFVSHQEAVAAASASDQFVRMVRVAFLLTLILTYIISGFWIYRAACNVRAMGARRLENTPGWAVGWYCIPFMSLFKPFSAMVEIWNASLSPERWQTRPVPGLLRWWWGLWLGVGMFGYIQGALSRAGTTIPSLIFVTQSGMADAALDVAATVVFLAVVWRITRMQTSAPATASQVAAVFS